MIQLNKDPPYKTTAVILFIMFVFFPSWVKKGIYVVGGILSSDGNIMERNEIELKYDFEINYLNYFTIKSGLKDFLRNFSCKGLVNFNYLRPCVPTHLKSKFSKWK